MPFLQEDEPTRGAVHEVLPGVRRIVAANPGVMTYHGTNTYLIDGPDGIVVLDPGPDNAGHVADILRATGGKIALILLTHTHQDHGGAAPALQAATRAPTAGFHRSALDSFTPDRALEDGAEIAGLAAIHTPGHAADHLCFARREDGAPKILFSGDHVMSWSSSIVNPPGGDMADYFAGLRRLLDRDDDVFLPGHGPLLNEPRDLVAELLHHRERREESIHAALHQGPSHTEALMDMLYSQTHPMLRRAAERNVLAHLIKLEGEGKAVRDGALWRAA